MRLTLRTLLAYLDEILEPDDARELEQKIKESEVAGQLAHRIRHVVSQRRSDAPSITAEGLGSDANSVAEYLDNNLPPDKVAEFERICLESDAHLAEVAACHQILTLVLGEPAEIAPQLKERIYQLPQRLAAEPAVEDPAPPAPPDLSAAALAAVSDPAAEAPPIMPARAARPEPDADEHWTKAPDYLRRPRAGRWKSLALTALIALLLALAGLRGMGRLDGTHPLAHWLGYGPAVTVAQQSSAADAAAARRGAESVDQATTDAADTPTAVASRVPPPAPAESSDRSPLHTEEAAALPTTETGASETGADAAAAASDQDMQDEPVPPETADAAPAAVPSAVAPEMATDAATRPAEPGPDTEMSSELPAADVAEASVVPPAPEPRSLINPLAPSIPAGDETAAMEPALPSLPDDPTALSDVQADSAAQPPADTQGLEAGRSLSEDQLLVRYGGESPVWERVASRSPLQVGQPLVALPTYRPEIMLPTGMQLTLIGPARAAMDTPPDNETPQVRLEFGKITVVTFARAGSKIGLAWGNRTAVAFFADMDTALAAELSRELVPGTDPGQEQAHIVLRVYPTSGHIEWRQPDAPPFQVPTGQQLTLVDDGAARLTAVTQLPDWIDGRDARPRDPIAARGLETLVPTDRPVALSLKEQADSKRVEVRSLAACSLAYLGEFDPLLVAMNDVALKSYWSDQYRVLNGCLALDQEYATRIRQALAQRHGDEGESLYRMLWGYTAQQLTDGGAKTLVDNLDHASSDFRVAAIENLKAITGAPSLYLPHFTETQRRAAVFKWREKLNEGQIEYAKPPEIVQLLEAETKAP